jgi:hypothetical protein
LEVSVAVIKTDLATIIDLLCFALGGEEGGEGEEKKGEKDTRHLKISL